jgi:hypothetical protein
VSAFCLWIFDFELKGRSQLPVFNPKPQISNPQSHIQDQKSQSGSQPADQQFPLENHLLG